MFFSCLRRGVLSFFVAFIFLFPRACFAFEVSPSVSDLFFSGETGEVIQLISVFNTEIDQKTYETEVQLITFALDGSIVGFSDVPNTVGAKVSPETAEVSAGIEQIFTVKFSHPEKVTSDQVFGLVIHERDAEHQQLSAAFVALMFPEGIVSADLGHSFRIDEFTIAVFDGALQGSARFTNTGNGVVKPASIILAQDIFGRELRRSLFAEGAGRLPVGTARVVSDTLPYRDFGPWHVGGPVLFSLLSVADGGGAVQQASAQLMTMPGKGAIAVMGFVVVFFLGGTLFFVKRRGILRA